MGGTERADAPTLIAGQYLDELGTLQGLFDTDPETAQTSPGAKYYRIPVQFRDGPSESWREKCLTDGEMTVAVYHEGEGADHTLPLELQVSYGKVAGTQTDRPEYDDPAIPTVKPRDAEQVPGGDSFNAAAAMEPGATVTDTLVPGETKYDTVPAEAAQSLAIRLDVGADSREAVGLRTYNPLRELMYVTSGADVLSQVESGGEAMHLIVPEKGAHATNVLVHPIDPAARNRSVDLAAGATVSVPGGQYLAVYRETEDDSGQDEIPFDLTVEQVGEAGQTEAGRRGA